VGPGRADDHHGAGRGVARTGDDPADHRPSRCGGRRPVELGLGADIGRGGNSGIYIGTSDAGDNLSVDIGLDLWDNHPGAISDALLKQTILDNLSQYVTDGKATPGSSPGCPPSDRLR
jgi:hypothetical protein